MVVVLDDPKCNTIVTVTYSTLPLALWCGCGLTASFRLKHILLQFCRQWASAQLRTWRWRKLQLSTIRIIDTRVFIICRSVLCLNKLTSFFVASSSIFMQYSKQDFAIFACIVDVIKRQNNCNSKIIRIIGTNKLHLTRKSYLFTDYCFDNRIYAKIEILLFKIAMIWGLGCGTAGRWTRVAEWYVVLGSLGRHRQRRTPMPRRQSEGSVTSAGHTGHNFL